MYTFLKMKLINNDVLKNISLSVDIHTEDLYYKQIF